MELNMNELCAKVGVKDNFQKNCLSELVFLAIEGNPRQTGYLPDDRERVRRAVYGEDFDSLQEKVLDVAGYWSNDLTDALTNSLGFDGKLFDFLFKELEGIEICEGIGFNLKKED